MAEIKNYKTEVLIFSLPRAPVWIIMCTLWGVCPWSLKFQCARLRVSPPSNGLSGHGLPEPVPLGMIISQGIGLQ